MTQQEQAAFTAMFDALVSVQYHLMRDGLKHRLDLIAADERRKINAAVEAGNVINVNAGTR